MAYWVYKLAHKEKWKAYQKYSFDEMILFLIDNYSLFHEYEQYSTRPKNIDSVYRNFYMPWRYQPMIYTTRFESLVGSKGGGSTHDQIREIMNIASHLGYPITRTRAQEIAFVIFGAPNVTFREGKIGSWKQHFKPVHKIAFKRVAGKLLIDLGYEKNLYW